MKAKLTYRNITRRYVFVLIVLLTLIQSGSFAQFSIQKIIDRTDTIQDLNKRASTFLFLAEYYMQTQPDSAIIFANQALVISMNQMDSMNICDAYICLSIAYGGKLECERSEDYFLTGLPYAVTVEDSARMYSDMGTTYTLCGDLQKAQKCHSIAREMYTRLSDQSNLARLITNLGVLHARNSNYYQAFECYLEAMELSEALEDDETIAGIYQNMGEVMALQGQYDKAVGYFNSALFEFEKLERYPSMAGIYLNLGMIFIEQEQWDVAKHYLNKSYVLDTTYKLKNFESEALKLLGITYLRINKLESAERLIAEALRIQKKNGYITYLGETWTILAEVYYKQGKLRESLDLLKLAEEHAKEMENDNLLVKALQLKSDILADLGQYGQAYHSLYRAKMLEDSIFNIERSKSIMNLELAYQTEKNENLINELKYTDTVKNEKLNKRTAQVYLLVVSVILLIVLFVFLIVYWLKRQQIENQKRERRFLQGRFEAEERAKDEIANELHDDIGGQMIGMILQFESTQKLSDAELEQLQKVYQDVRRLSHSLDEPLFVDVNLQEKVRNYLSELKEFVSFKSQFIDDLTIDWGKIYGQQELQRNIYRIVQELITNTIKYANATRVDIQMLNEVNTFVMIYEDDGLGMSPEKAKDNFSFNTVRKRVEIFGGTCEINSSPDDGIFVKVSIKLKQTKSNKIS